MSTLLHAAGVSFAYEQGTPVLRDICLDLHAGELCGIAGPNGSGKSTLMRLLAGQMKGYEGRILVKGAPLESFSARERGRLVAYLPQAVQPVFSLTVREVVALGRFPHSGYFDAMQSIVQEDEVVAACLSHAAVKELAARRFDTLSGGERQRVLLASILAQEPEILLLDEPTTALDLHHQQEMFELLRDISRNSGRGVCVITHDLNLAGQFCDRILLLNCEHRAAACGPPWEVLREDVLSAAYGARMGVGTHPFTGTPLVHSYTERPAP